MSVAFLFPGQGAQAVGMGRAAADASPAARQLFADASEILGRDLFELCTAGPEEELHSTIWSQPALFVASLAALEVLREQQPETVAACSSTAGLSLGEYTALTFAGVLSFESGLRLVAARGRAMQDASDRVASGMVSVLGLEEGPLRELCDRCRQDEVLEVANLLCPGNIACSGHLTACQRLAEAAPAAGATRTVPLTVAGAFHTELMQPAVGPLRAALEEAEFNSPALQVVLNVTGQPCADPAEIKERLAEQIVSPVLWEKSLRFLLEDRQIEKALEIGPGRVIRGTLKRISRRFPCDGFEA